MEYNNYVKKVIKADSNLKKLAKNYWYIFPEMFYDENPSEERCLSVVKENGELLGLIKDQTEKICLEAVRQNGNALRYVKD